MLGTRGEMGLNLKSPGSSAPSPLFLTLWGFIRYYFCRSWQTAFNNKFFFKVQDFYKNLRALFESFFWPSQRTGNQKSEFFDVVLAFILYWLTCERMTTQSWWGALCGSQAILEVQMPFLPRYCQSSTNSGCRVSWHSRWRLVPLLHLQ